MKLTYRFPFGEAYLSTLNFERDHSRRHTSGDLSSHQASSHQPTVPLASCGSDPNMLQLSTSRLSYYPLSFDYCSPSALQNPEIQSQARVSISLESESESHANYHTRINFHCARLRSRKGVETHVVIMLRVLAFRA
ncbi:hypothetical protein HYDPIDRAFT_114555 [Hydnomerulius pinastri MD-312]|uniref:Uncharacterized protein n=1 Tax=Hydnomerulius pinastri MD-312 TaxID=994086 RepID=A0A0C9W6B4_9AGAM|nr:hypothetical protein HYDPIDRAFT_114555 [Hydnomerulius pinastri MD-312]